MAEKRKSSPLKISVRLQLYAEQDGCRIIAGSRLLKGDDAPTIQFDYDLDDVKTAKDAAERLEKHANQKTK